MAAEERPFRVYAEVEMVLQFLKASRNRAETALADLRAKRGEAYAIEAVERALNDITETTERLKRDGLRLDRASEIAA
jgi:hypothetical protein